MKRKVFTTLCITFIANLSAANLTREIALELVYNSTDTLIIPSCYGIIDERAFENLSFEKLVIPGTVKVIKQNAFAECDFRSVIIKEGLEKIENFAFSSNTNAFQITLPVSIKSISHTAFVNSIVDVYTESKIAMRLASYGDISVYKLSDNGKNAWWRKITFDKSLFKQRPLVQSEVIELCDGCEQLDIPKKYTIIGKLAFSENNNLTTVKIPESIERINAGAFFCCDLLENVYFSNNLIKIEDEAFYNCQSIKSISIPNSVSSIGNNAFFLCASLRTLRLPAHFTVTYRNFFDCISDKRCVAVYVNDVHIGRFRDLTIRQPRKINIIRDGCLI